MRKNKMTVDTIPDMSTNPEEVLMSTMPDDVPSDEQDNGMESVEPTNLERSIDDVRNEMNVSAANYVAAIADNDFAAVQRLNEELSVLESEYYIKEQARVFGNLMKRDNPILAAVTAYQFEVYRHKDTVDKESGVVSRDIVAVNKPIDLAKLCKYIKDRDAARVVTPDAQWIYRVQRFNQLMTARAAVQMGLNPKEIYDSYYMGEVARQIDMGKTPTSNTKLLVALQSCLDSILGGYKATSHDVAYLLMTYTKKGRRALSVAAANHQTMRTLMADILHHLVTGNSYSVEYKAAKAK